MVDVYSSRKLHDDNEKTTVFHWGFSAYGNSKVEGAELLCEYREVLETDYQMCDDPLHVRAESMTVTQGCQQ
jgi:hypothetical protein